MTIEDVQGAIRHANRVIRGSEELVDRHERRTRYYIIDPIMRSLGWDTSNPVECELEYQLPAGKADYALFVNRRQASNPVVILEAKGMGVQLLPSGEKQLAGYARGIRRGTAVLTNGRIWRIYDLSNPARFFSSKFKDTKFVREMDISSYPQAASVLTGWLSRNNWVSTKGRYC